MDSISLMYHCIYASIPQESGFQGAGAMIYKISSVDFEKQVNAISKYLEKNNLEKEAVTFTFDDGGVSFITIIAPILERYGYRGLFFISTRYIGTEGFLTVDQIKELVTRGHMVGSHSHTHPEMMNTMKEEDLIYEWKISGDILREIIGKKVVTASIPNGFCSNKVLSAMVKTGFSSIYTSKPTVNIHHYESSVIIGRYAITSDMSVDYVLSILSSKKHRFLINLRFQCLGIAKQMLGSAYVKIRGRLLSK